MAKVSPSVAAAEAAIRIRSRASLLDYAKSIDIPGAPVSDDENEWVFKPVETGLAAHHILLLQTIEKVIKGELPRCMLFLPPGSAKSSYGSVVAPTWAMGRQPGTKIILTSYGSDLAKKHGRKARQIVRSPRFCATFETELSKETSAADEWALANGSEYMAAGILSGVTGNRANGLIIDDPIRGRQQADSETVRDTTWSAYQDDLRTRLIPGGWEILIQTRWHEDDIAGRLLPENYDGECGLIRCRDGRDWYVLCLPAECDRLGDPLGRKIGDYLWPEWFTPEHFAGFKSQVRTWSALFQQRPQPDSGTFFERDWFTLYQPGTEPTVYKYGASDYAVTDGGGDFTEHGVFGVDSQGDVWILDWWRGQTASNIWIDALLDMGRHKPLCWFGEAGVIRRALEPYITRRMQEREVFFRHEWLASITDKPTRARAAQGMASARKIHLPDNEDGRRILDHLIRFPTGPYDHDVDVISLFCRAIDEAHPAAKERPKDNSSLIDKRLDDLEKPYVDPSLVHDDISIWDRELHYGGINTVE